MEQSSGPAQGCLCGTASLTHPRGRGSVPAWSRRGGCRRATHRVGTGPPMRWIRRRPQCWRRSAHMVYRREVFPPGRRIAVYGFGAGPPIWSARASTRSAQGSPRVRTGVAPAVDAQSPVASARNRHICESVAFGCLNVKPSMGSALLMRTPQVIHGVGATPYFRPRLGRKSARHCATLSMGRILKAPSSVWSRTAVNL